jgi:hypothetical protein
MHLSVLALDDPYMKTADEHLHPDTDSAARIYERLGFR